jgi:hypothetical protein
MFDKLETLDEARALVRSLSTEQLAQMTFELTVAWLSGEVSDEICTAVALLIEESSIERIDAEMQKDIVTVH